MKFSELKCYNVALILLIRTIQQYSFGSFNHIFIDEKINYTKCVHEHIDLRKYSLLLSDFALIQTNSFTKVHIAFALTPPPQHKLPDDLPCFIYFATLTE